MSKKRSSTQILSAAAAMILASALTGCGGGGGGSSSSPGPSAPQIVAGKHMVVKSTRQAQVNISTMNQATGNIVITTSDTIEEVLFFDSSGNIVLSESEVTDLTHPAQGTITTATLSSNGTLQESFSFPSLSETDTFTGTLVTSNSGDSATIQNGSDSITKGGSTTTVTLDLAGSAEDGTGSPVNLAALNLTPASYSGTINATDSLGNVLASGNASVTLGSDGSVYGLVTYLDSTNTPQTQVITGQIDSNGDYYELLPGTNPTQTISELFSVSTGTGGTLNFTGSIFDNTGNLIVNFSGALSPS